MSRRKIVGSTFVLAHIARNGRGSSRPSLGEIVLGRRVSIFEEPRPFSKEDLPPLKVLKSKKTPRL